MTTEEKKAQGAKIANAANNLLHSTDPEIQEAGLCLRFARLSVQNALGKEAWPVPQGLDAKDAYSVFLKLGWDLPFGTPTLPGDLVFWTGINHGRHGHVAVRKFGNEIAENSSLHVGPGDKNALGTRPLAAVDKTARWVRIGGR